MGVEIFATLPSPPRYVTSPSETAIAGTVGRGLVPRRGPVDDLFASLIAATPGGGQAPALRRTTRTPDMGAGI